ncbi:hypothetical protein IDSA_10310 [Pseudidiomarina salinarum]|uniref:DUF3014 domain-containing protein n=1 Tax=Pseudidiomarina salinarum TaxID=435908 RepID=A0A094IRY3_9GAMM|nr:DUF3014 domain-containing protein [Pseudidiomarina salinarum]KFZ30445.1 hypothetical protein IDSA_10310 [Pseudidiomarina salinarum]RUO68596.1 DUF3014 domain-containing protein [Pseudidiomarina salinarum]
MKDLHEEELEQKSSQGKLMTTLVIVIAIAVAVIAWLWQQQDTTPEPTPEPAETVVTQSEPPTPSEPQPDVEVITEAEEPLEEIPEPAPDLPELENSTDEVMEDLRAAEQNVEPIQSERLIRDAVVFVDNLRNGLVVRDNALLPAPKSRFRVLEQNEKIYIDPRSYDRYNSTVDWFVSLDTGVLVNLFNYYQPLAEEALGEIGYPDAAPDEVLLEAINLLLDTPSAGTVIELTDDDVMYKFADPSLESLPPAQKQMLRLGPDNMRRVKLKLESLKQELTEQ